MIKKEYALSLVLIFLNLLLVTSAPPFQTSTSTTGLIIEYPKITNLKQNVDFSFNFHVYNATTGLSIQTPLSCVFHLYNISGSHVYNMNISSLVDDDYEAKILGKNFSVRGDYNYIFQCNSTSQGGFVSVPLVISLNGHELTTQESIIYSILLFMVLTFFSVCFYFALTLPFADHKNDRGETILLTKSKYIKLLMITVSYGLLTWILNLLIALSDNFVYLTAFYGMFKFIFNGLIDIAYIFFVIVLIIAVIEVIKDFKFKKRINEMFGVLK